MTTFRLSQLSRTALFAATVFTLSACGSSNDGDSGNDPGNMNPGTPPLGSNDTGDFAFVASRADDYSSGRIDRISLDKGNTVDASYPATLSDIAVATDNDNLYQIGRFNIDSITRFSPTDSSAPDYQFSVLEGDEQSANPQAIAFIDQTKAYLTRRGSDKLWIINPDPETPEDFKIGELDLGAYDTDLPNMTDAIIVDDKLFVLVERLRETPNAQIPEKSGFLVVYDTRTDTEIETNQSTSDLKGIELLVTNPTALQYNAITGEIYVVGRGNYFENAEVTTDFYSGGIEVIDPTTYQHSLLLDDGNEQDNQGYFVDAEVINADIGYLLTYAGFGVTTLRTFNPTSGVLLDTLFEGLQDVDITIIEKGPDNHLWVGTDDTNLGPGFYRIDLSTGEIAEERLSTELIPSDLVFINVPAAE